VPRALFTIGTEPRTVSNCSLFVMIFPGMVVNIAEVLCHSRSSKYHWYNFGILQLPESFHFILEVLVFGHVLDFCIVSSEITCINTSLSNAFFSIFGPKYDFWLQCFVFDVHPQWDHSVVHEQEALPCFQSMVLVDVPTNFLELGYQSFC